MSKSVTIPQIGADPLVIKINQDEELKFKAGQTYTVSDEVAAVIENILASFPQESGKNAPLVPSPSVADAGKVIKVDEDGNYALGEGGSGGTVVVTISNIRPVSQTSFNADSSMFSWEIYNKLLEGKTVQAVIDLTPLGGSYIYFVNISNISPDENKESIIAYAYVVLPGADTYSLTIYGSEQGHPGDYFNALLTIIREH